MSILNDTRGNTDKKTRYHFTLTVTFLAKENVYCKNYLGDGKKFDSANGKNVSLRAKLENTIKTGVPKKLEEIEMNPINSTFHDNTCVQALKTCDSAPKRPLN